MAGSQEGADLIEVRQLATHDEFARAVELQQVIWGFADIELLPVRLFVVATKIGGAAFGAFEGGRMIGFCLGIPGIKPGGRSYLHSHMLGVLPEYHNRGVGRMLKLKQREKALAAGINVIEWTFDPLEIRNAHFNIERLGAVIRRFVPNQYGTTSSHLHGSLPTDRCIAEWWIGGERVRAAVEGRVAPRPPAIAFVAIPNAIATLRRQEPRAAREIQKRAGDQFQEHFAKGLTVIGLERTAEAGVYQLGKFDEA